MVASISLYRARSGVTLKMKEGAGSNDFIEIYLDLEGDNSYLNYRAVLKTSKGAHVWTDKDLPTRVSEFAAEDLPACEPDPRSINRAARW